MLSIISTSIRLNRIQFIPNHVFVNLTGHINIAVLILNDVFILLFFIKGLSTSIIEFSLTVYVFSSILTLLIVLYLWE